MWRQLRNKVWQQLCEVWRKWRQLRNKVWQQLREGRKRDNNCETTKCDSNYVKEESVTTTAKQDGVTTTTWRKKAWQQLRNKVWQQLCEERKRDNNCEIRRCDNNYVKKESVTTAKRQGRRKRYFSISEVKPYKTHLLHEAATGRRVLRWCSKKKPLRHRQQLTGAAK